MTQLSTSIPSTENPAALDDSLAFRRLVRRLAGAHASCLVALVDGEQAPSYEGQSFHWETMGGSMIYHPSAYSRRGWSNMRYVGTTLRVEVGRDWLRRVRTMAALARDVTCLEACDKIACGVDLGAVDLGAVDLLVSALRPESAAA